MVDSKEIAKWTNKAEDDYNFASSILPDTTFYSHVCFFFQQAAEKYLKAYIVKNNLEFRKIHDLTKLLEICEKENSAFSSLLEDCQLLNALYIDTRYPVHWPSMVSKGEAQKAEQSASKIKEFVKKLI